MNSSKGKLFLLPVLLGDTEVSRSLPQFNLDIINEIDFYVVENLRSARRFLIKAGIEKKIDELTFFELNKHTDPKSVNSFLDPVKEGKNVGVLSEAGCPGVADPGSSIVKLAHKRDMPVVPLVGASSILLALMASGFNGQNFAFHGYLPRDKNALAKKLKELESHISRENQTQIFMEAPYRNDSLLEQVFKSCSDKTRLCIACDLTLNSEFIKTKSIHEWKKGKVPKLHKRPCIFLIYG